MKTRNIILIAFLFMIAAFSCKPKSIERSGVEEDANSAPADNRVRSESKVSEAAKVTTNPEHMADTAKRVNAVDSGPPSLKKLDKELMDALALIPPPKNKKENDAISALFRKTLEGKKELLFSIPITPQAQRDCDEAWKTLETNSFFDNNQDKYVRKLLMQYSGAPQLERLVVWRLIELRMESGLKRGSAVDEVVLKVEMAKFLLSALGVDKHELFEAMSLKSRTGSEEAGRIGNQAEEEIERIYIEQSEKAESILENHFK